MTTTEPSTEVALIVPAFELDDKSASELNTVFAPFHGEALKYIEASKAITVTSADQTREMRLCREYRLALKDIRVRLEKQHKVAKQDVLLRGRAIDGIKNIILAEIAPAEAHLLEQEQFAASAQAKLIADRAEARREQLTPYSDPSVFANLGEMEQGAFDTLFGNLKLAHEARLAAAAKAEADQIAKEAAEAAERERIRLENEKLKAEAIEREAKAKAERESALAAKTKAEAEAQAERERAAAELKAQQETARKEREAYEAQVRAQRAQEEAERQAQIKSEQEARVKQEAAAKKERDALEAKAKAEKDAREKAEAELKAAQEAERLKKEAVEKAVIAAKKAPDKTKLLTFAASIRALQVPELTTVEGEAVVSEISSQIEKFAAWVEKKASAL